MSWHQGTKLRVRLSLANARFASLLSKVMYIIKRKFKCLSWMWLSFSFLHMKLSWKGSSLKGKNFLPLGATLGANSFLLKTTLFQKRWGQNQFVSVASSESLSISLNSALFAIYVSQPTGRGMGGIFIFVRILLVSVSVSVWNFLVCTISCKPVVGFLPNFHGYIIWI